MICSHPIWILHVPEKSSTVDDFFDIRCEPSRSKDVSILSTSYSYIQCLLMICSHPIWILHVPEKSSTVDDFFYIRCALCRVPSTLGKRKPSR